MYIVFGSSGFIGKSLRNYLIDKYGENQIICIDRKKFNNKYYKKINLSKRFTKLNLNLPRIKTAFVLSADSRVIINEQKEEKKQHKTNKVIIQNILKILNKKKHIENIVYFSSSAVYSSFNKKPFKESQKLKPVIMLGKSKLYGEKKITKFCEKNKIRLIVLRLFTVYGPGIGMHQFISQAIKKIFSKKKQINFWNKNTLRSFIYINDLIKIIDIILSSKFKKKIIVNIGGATPLKIQKVVNLILKITKIKKRINYLHSKNSIDHIPSFEVLKQIIKKKFRFTSIEKGLRDTVHDLQVFKKM